MICNTCAFNGKCLSFNYTREFDCPEFVPLCKNCKYNSIVLEPRTKKVREGKKIVTKTYEEEVHYCTRLSDKFVIQPETFCSWGVRLK